MSRGSVRQMTSRDHGGMTYADGLDGLLAEQVAYYRAARLSTTQAL